MKRIEINIDRLEVDKLLRTAIQDIHKEYPNFQGIFVYGSFVDSDSKPNDVDILPILAERENERENHWLRGEELISLYFNKYFPDFQEPIAIKKSAIGALDYYRVIGNILHAGHGVAYIAEQDNLRNKLNEIKAELKHFVGSEEATETIRDILYLD